MDKVLSDMHEAGDDTLLLYGECHNHMDEYDNDSTVARTCGSNCVEILLGHDEFRRLLKDGAFFLLPEWAERWEEIFRIELGLSEEVGKEFMQEMHKYFLYIDTGLVPIPVAVLDEVSAGMGLPWKSISISTDNLLNEIIKSIDSLG